MHQPLATVSDDDSAQRSYDATTGKLTTAETSDGETQAFTYDGALPLTELDLSYTDLREAGLLAVAALVAALPHGLRTLDLNRRPSTAKGPSLAGQSSPSPPPHLASFGVGRLDALWRSRSATQRALRG